MATLVGLSFILPRIFLIAAVVVTTSYGDLDVDRKVGTRRRVVGLGACCVCLITVSTVEFQGRR